MPAPAYVPAGDPVPELRDVVALAKQRSAAVLAAGAGAKATRATYAGARLGAVGNPVVELTASRSAQRVTKDLSFVAALWLPLEVAGQRRGRVAEVDAAVDVADAATQVARAQAAAAATRAFGSVVVAMAKVKTAEEILKVSRDEAAFFEARVAARDATQADLTLAVVEVAQNGVSLMEARADLARALADLAQVTGAEGYAPTTLPLEPPGGEPRVRLDDVPSVDLARKEATYFVRAADRFAREAQPPVNLIAQIGRGDLGETRWTLGLGWAFPVARAHQGERARAHAEAERARIEGDARRRVLSAELKGLSGERKEVRAAILHMTDVAVPAAKAAVDAAQETYRAGKTEVLRVFTARRDLATLRLRQLSLVGREWEIVSEMVRATGELP